MSSKIIRGQTASILSAIFDAPYQSCTPPPPRTELGLSDSGDHQRTTEDEDAAREAALVDALERGRQEGRLAAAAEHASAAESLIAQVAKTAAHLARETPRLRRNAESDVVRLALAIAKRVIHREISLDQQAIQGLVRVAIDRLNSREIVRIRTHPLHRDAVGQVLESARLAGHVELSADISLRVGDLIFETSHGELDASIESQLKEIELGIADRLGR